MHELAMATSMVEAIVDTAEKNNAIEITEAVLDIGELTMLNPEQLRFMMDVVREGTIFEGAEIIINMIPIEIECENCGFKGMIKTDENTDHIMVAATCPECNTTRVHVTQGRECTVKTIKIEKEE